MLIDRLGEAKENITIYQSESILLYGAVRDKLTDCTAVIGPVRAVPLDEELVEKIVKLYDVSAQRVSLYLNELPVITVGKFSELLSAIHTAVNDEVVSPNDLYERVTQWKPDSDVVRATLKKEEEHTFDEATSERTFELEQQLLYLVQNGLVDELKERWQNILPENLFAITNDSSVRNAKNHCILGLALISGTAMKAGVAPETALVLREQYLKKTEECTSLQQVMQLRYTIFCDFTERTRRIRFKMPDSPFIDRAVNYILSNIAKELTLADVATRLNTNKTYLSTKFKQAMGMSFTDFVNMQKVEKAKELLLFTDKSLLEISTYLSFSSQGYFQIVFKKFTGVTPGAFRKNKPLRTPQTD